MVHIRAGFFHVFIISFAHCVVFAQCPTFSNFSVTGNEPLMCEGDMMTISMTGQDIPPGSTVDFYLGSGNFNPYIGEGDFIGSVPSNPIPAFTWTVPTSFCENYGEGGWSIVAILDPPPAVGCPTIFTPYFDVPVSCPTMSLSGGGDVCEGNCPDSPNEIVFNVTGNDLPFEADLVVTASLFPPYAINDLVITNGQQLFICLGGIVPSFDPVTNTLTIPSFAIGFTAVVEVVSLTSASGCTVEISPNSIMLHFIEAATADAGSDQTICSYEQVTLSGEVGGSATIGMWSTNGDGIFANANDLTTSYAPGPGDTTNGNVIITLTGTDVNGACIPAESSINISIEPSLTIDAGPPMTICNTDVANISAMITGPNVPGIWETDGDGIFADPTDPSTTYQPGGDDIGNGSVTLIYSPSDPGVCVESNEPLEITIVNAPVVNVPQNIEVCSDDSITIHINVNGNFTDINWSTTGDGIIMIINDTEINYTPGPQDIIDQFTIVSVTVVSGFPECGQTTYNMPIDIILCNCEAFETIPPAAPLCSTEDTLDLSALFVEGGSGSWSITGVPSGSNPAMIIGNDFITNSSDPGSYTVTYTLNFPEDGCPPTSSEIILVSQELEPDAGNNIANCGPSIVFVNGVVSPIGFSSSTMWETLGDGSFVNPFTLATSYIPGPMDSSATQITLVLHLIDPVCGDKSDTTMVLFPEPPVTLFVDDTLSVCNEMEKGSVIDFLSLITGGDNTGTWMNSSGVPVDFSNPANVDFNGIAPGFYNFNYQTNSAMFPCQEADYSIVIEVEECVCPLLEIQSLPGGLCNSLSQINLAAFVIAGAPGSWSIISGPMGSNPATLNGSELQILNADSGLYRLRFTFDEAPILACPDSAEIDIYIQAMPAIAAMANTASCGLLDIQLNATIGGSATGLLWTTSGLGMFNDPSMQDPVYSPSVTDLNSANVTLYATTNDTSGFCNNAIDSIEVMLVHPPMTSFSSLSTNICNNPDSGTIVNFTSFIVSGDGTGIWTDLAGGVADVSNPSSVDFDGVLPGTYTFSYLTQTAVAPCTDSTYLFTVTVEDCACPALLFDTIPIPLCIPSGIDLNALIFDAPPGIWSIMNGPPGGVWPLISGPDVITSDADDGSYQLVYELLDSIPGCPATHMIPFTLESSPVLSFGAPDCNEMTLMYSIPIATNAAFINVDFGMLSETSPGNYILENIPSGQNVIFEVSSMSGTCSASFSFDAPDCECTLVTEDISDTIFLCPGDTFVLIPFLTGAQGLAFSTWISDDETLMRPTLPLFEENTWIWVLIDSAGCETRDTFNVAIRESLIADVFSLPPTCDGLTNGAIIINDLTNGKGPYTVQLDNQFPILISNLPDTIRNIGAGEYNLTFLDAGGCPTFVHIIINADSPGDLELGPDISIPYGDSVLIEPQLTDIIFNEVEWEPSTINAGVEPFWYVPSASTLLQLTITDSLGCIYQDEIFIKVLFDQHIFIPSIFSPNGDQINDVMEVFTSTLSNPIESLEIFDRWGNMIHQQNGIGPFTWSGTSHNREALPGVYVVKVIWKDENGNAKMLVRDLTLIR